MELRLILQASAASRAALSRAGVILPGERVERSGWWCWGMQCERAWQNISKSYLRLGGEKQALLFWVRGGTGCVHVCSSEI